MTTEKATRSGSGGTMNNAINTHKIGYAKSVGAAIIALGYIGFGLILNHLGVIGARPFSIGTIIMMAALTIVVMVGLYHVAGATTESDGGTK